MIISKTKPPDIFKYIIWILLVVISFMLFINLTQERNKSGRDAIYIEIISLFKGGSGVLFFLLDWVRDNMFQVGMLAVLALYIALSFYITSSYKIHNLFGGMAKYLNYCIIILGAMFTIAVLVSYMKRKNSATGTVIESLIYYKTIGNIIGISIIPVLAIFLINTFPKQFAFLTVSLTVLLIVTISGVYYMNSPAEAPRLVPLFDSFIKGIKNIDKGLYPLIALELIVIISYIVYSFVPKLFYEKLIYKTKPSGGGIEETDNLSELRKNKLISDRVAKRSELMALKNKYSNEKWPTFVPGNCHIERQKNLRLPGLVAANPHLWWAATRIEKKNKDFDNICKLNEKIHYLTGEIDKIVTKTVIPYDKLQTTILQNEPIYTNKLKQLGDLYSMKDLNNYNYNYCLSSWVFIHQQTLATSKHSTKPSSLLNFDYKPDILFDVSKNKLVINVQKTDIPTTYKKETDIPLQKWNNIVINYTGGTLDIFINSKLISSEQIIIKDMKKDLHNVTIGTDGGVSGGVCNVTYFPRPLTLPEISILYESLKLRSPPIV